MKNPSQEQLNVALLYSMDRLHILGDELIKVLDQLNPLERFCLKGVVESYKQTCEGLDKMMDSWPDASSHEKQDI